MNWHDLHIRTRASLRDSLSSATFADIDGVLETVPSDRDRKDVTTSASAHSTVIAREGVEWKNSLLVGVETDLEHAVVGFSDSLVAASNEEGSATTFRFNGPIPRGQHTLVLCLRKIPASLALVLYPTGSGEPVVKTFDLIG